MLSYVLPLRSTQPCSDLTDYLMWLSERADVIVVDGSDADVFSTHATWWGRTVRHMPVDPVRRTPMGKVGGVLTGVDHARHPALVIADDDVRYDAASLARMERLLEAAEVVRPQNVFTAWPWHAWWDTGRTLLARVSGGDWPGTLGVRRDMLTGSGYAGDVMFENLELVRTVRSRGGRELVALDLVIGRVPPSGRQFLRQRVRQAYDEFARPARLVVALAILPALVLGGRRVALTIAATSVVAAEVGRRRAGGRAFYPPITALAAPFWVGERALTSWMAVASRLLLGGVRYGDGTLVHAATTDRGLLRRRVDAPTEGRRTGLETGAHRPSRRMSTAVITAETTREPRHPKRFEKKRSMG